jgi:sulfoxide reductase heme-binding subunit YedZ
MFTAFTSDFTSGPMLWYANRATGVVLVVLLTASTAMGVYSTARTGSVRWPRFATQALHRNVSLLALLMLVLHIESAVIDTHVDIRWWDALVPFLGSYKAGWLGVGTVANDLTIAVVMTSMVRERFRHRLWRAVHLLSYVAWAAGLAHGIGIGTDRSTTWGMSVSALSAGVVATFGVVRLVTLAHERRLAA